MMMLVIDGDEDKDASDSNPAGNNDVVWQWKLWGNDNKRGGNDDKFCNSSDNNANDDDANNGDDNKKKEMWWL